MSEVVLPVRLSDEECSKLSIDGLHELCSLFPPMDDLEYQSLVDSMKTMGYMSSDPVILIDINRGSDDGDTVYKILDGRNRFLAASDAGVKPIFCEYRGNDPAGFVIARNTDRRHLSTGQKAAIASKIANMPVGGNQFNRDYTSINEAADMLQTSSKSILRFRFVENVDPELAEMVSDGTISLNEAEERAKTINSKAPGTSSVPVSATPRTDVAGTLGDGHGGISREDGDTSEGGADDRPIVRSELDDVISFLSDKWGTSGDLRKVIDEAVRCGYEVGFKHGGMRQH